MRRGVMGANGRAPMNIDRDFAFVTHSDRAVTDVSDVKDVVTDSSGVLDVHLAHMVMAGAGSPCDVNLADVTDLSTLFAVETGSIEDDRHALAVFTAFTEVASVPDRLDQTGGRMVQVFRVVVGRLHLQKVQFAKHVGWHGEDRIVNVSAGAALRSSCLHEDFIALRIDGHVSFFGHDLGEVDREAVGVMEFEGVDRGDPAIVGSLRRLGEQLEAAVKGATEHLLLLSDDLLDPGHLLFHFRERITEDLDHGGNDAGEEGPLHAERLAAMTDGTAKDSSEDVPATVRARGGAVRERRDEAASVIRDDAIRDVDRVFEVSAIGTGAADVGDAIEDSGEQIRVVVAAAILKNGNETFESHAGIDVLRR